MRKFCLFLLVALTIGISPALAKDAPVVKTLDLGLASDDEFAKALAKAGDIEFVNKDDYLSVSSAKAAGRNVANIDTLKESRRLLKLAEEAFSEADYDTSARLADDAAYLAIKSTAKALEDQASSDKP